MNMNSLVSCFGASLKGFFEYCEEQNGVKADDLNTLFSQYFELDSDVVPNKTPAKKEPVKAKKAPAKTPKRQVKDIELSDSGSDSEDDDDTSVASSSKKAPAKKAPAKKAEAKKAPAKKAEAKKAEAKKAEAKKAPVRKPSGKGKDVKPREEQIPLGDLDLNKKKLPELKKYSKERGLPVSGTKAQLIENLLNYEKEQDGGASDAKLDSVEEEDLGIQIKKPKGKEQKGKDLREPADKHKYEVETKHGVQMIHYSKLDGYFVLNDKNVVVGWVCSDDEANAEEDERVNILALDKTTCELAKELGLEFEVPENLDA